MKEKVRLTGFQALPTICFVLMGLYCSGQGHSAKIDLDSPKPVSLVTFNRIVDHSIKLLQTKKLADISDTDHINIMMCLNTIFMTKQNGSFQKRFTGGNYQALVRISDEKKYTKNVIKVYPNWIENRGMGFYFPKLKMELYGTPRPYALFNVQ
jgi:hypothetical protein